MAVDAPSYLKLFGSCNVLRGMNIERLQILISSKHILAVCFAFAMVVLMPYGADGCEAGRTVFQFITPPKETPYKVIPLSAWDEVDIPECEFWKDNFPFYPGETESRLANIANGIVVQHYKTPGFIVHPAILKSTESTVLPELEYKMVYNARTPMLEVMTNDGLMKAPKEAFHLFTNNGAFIAASKYSCAPNPLFFYFYKNRKPYEVTGPEVNRLYKTGNAIWGLGGSGYYHNNGHVVRIRKNAIGNWQSFLHQKLDGWIIGSMQYNKDKAFILVSATGFSKAGGVSLLALTNEGVEPVITLPVQMGTKTDLIRDKRGSIYFLSGKGVLKITDFDSWIGPFATLLVPDETFLEIREPELVEKLCRSDAEIAIDELIELATDEGPWRPYFWMLLATSVSALVLGVLIFRNWIKRRRRRRKSSL
jgi:hypothetical protein